MNILLDDYKKFESNEGETYSFVRFLKPDRLLVWQELDSTDGMHHDVISKLRADYVGSATLQELGVWNSLAKSMQELILDDESMHKEHIHGKMEKARSSRRQKYPNIPRELTCTLCKKVIKTVPSALAKKLDKLDLAVEKYAETFECSVCSPKRRGREAKDYGGVPDKMVCSCGHIQNYHPSMIIKMAMKKGKTVEEFVKDYHCQSCVPSRGRKKKNK